jgi:regulatory protein
VKRRPDDDPARAEEAVPEAEFTLEDGPADPGRSSLGDGFAGPGQSSPEEDLQRALDAAYRYLNRRDRTAAEVRQRLEQAGTATAIVDEAIAILTEQHVLDDERYARLFVEDKRALEQWGADRIRRALRTRGVDRDLIEHALGADASSEDELGRALELLRSRFPTPPQDRRERDRALGVMLRKGYDAEVAIDALAAYARDPTPH